MHEINAAAELITNASDPDANIIFGATVDNDLEDEVIITVVATGFDASYFSNRHEEKKELQNEYIKDEDDEVANKLAEGKPEEIISEIDMNLEKEKEDQHNDFHNDNMPNIWSMDNEDSSQTDNNEYDSNRLPEEELEKPSFLRRLRNRKKNNDDNNILTD